MNINQLIDELKAKNAVAPIRDKKCKCNNVDRIGKFKARCVKCKTIWVINR